MVESNTYYVVSHAELVLAFLLGGPQLAPSLVWSGLNAIAIGVLP